MKPMLLTHEANVADAKRHILEALSQSPRFSVSLGLISLDSLRLDLLLAPAVIVGALVGRRLARHMNQRLFDRLVLALTIVSATYLLVQ